MVPTIAKVREFAEERDIELQLADGFEQALVGVGRQFNRYAVVYDRAKCIDVLRYRDEMSRQEAEEFFEFNVVGAYVGENTPIFLDTLP